MTLRVCNLSEVPPGTVVKAMQLLRTEKGVDSSEAWALTIGDEDGSSGLYYFSGAYQELVLGLRTIVLDTGTKLKVVAGPDAMGIVRDYPDIEPGQSRLMVIREYVGFYAWSTFAENAAAGHDQTKLITLDGAVHALADLNGGPKVKAAASDWEFKLSDESGVIFYEAE